MEGYIAEIRLFAGNFAPQGWHFCDGTLLTIANNQALFSIIGTVYGGDGRTNFALPDLRGRVPISAGRGSGLINNYALGQYGGEESHMLTGQEMPSHAHNGPSHTHSQTAHTHTAKASNTGTQASPENRFWANGGSRTTNFSDSSDGTMMNANAIESGGGGNTGSAGDGPTSAAGSSQPHNNMQPYLGLNYIICLEGMYPPRN